ncbi:MAG TPA: hypothetical protein VFS43_34315 [Polyangiaceae bacterium]|nr:hypothetical protein [Polyangiaceae bacterium]
MPTPFASPSEQAKLRAGAAPVPIEQGSPAAPAPNEPPKRAAATILGMPAPFGPPAEGAAAPPAGRGRGAVTQLGVIDPMRALGPGEGGAGGTGGSNAGQAAAPGAARALAPGAPLEGKSTVLGLGQGSPPSPGKSTALGLGPSAGAGPKIEYAPIARNEPSLAERRTLPGVAIPGIAPVAGEGPKRRPGVPKAQAAALEGAVREKVGHIVRRRPRGGASWAWALGGAGVIAVGGLGAALLVPGSAPLRAEVRLDEAGRDVLRVTCVKCPDGTKLSAAGGATVTTSGGAADVPLGAPLKVGANEVEIAVDRPGAGRDERVSLTVPLAFRIWADLRTLQDATPTLTVMVEALPGSAVTLQGRPVALDAEGRGREAFDVRGELRGPRGEPATLSKQVPYTVAPKGGKLETGSVDVRVGVVPLALEAPGPKLVTERATFLLAGRTAKGAGVSVGGRALSVQPDGAFVQWMSISDEGTSEVEVRALAPPLAPRLATVTVTRVRSLADEAKKREQQGGPGYAEVAGSPEASVGRAVAWRGEVVEAANQGQRTVAVVSVRSGCEAPPCLARTELSGPGAVARGDKVGLFGSVSGFAPLRDGQVPEIASEFFVK